MSRTTIVLAYSPQLIRESLRALLEAERDFAVAGEAADGLEAVVLVERLKPNVLIVDQTMPGLSGLEATRRVSRRTPATRTIVLSSHTDEAYVGEALRNGARAYVLKDASAAALVQAVLEVIAERIFLSPPLSERAVEEYIQQAQGSTPDPYEMLTSRERQVLQLAAEGYTSANIAARLRMKPRTAESHRANMMHKLGLHTERDVILYALRRRIISLEE